MYGPRADPNYSPGEVVRFFRSQRAWNGEAEGEQAYRSSPEIAGWAAARPFPNLVPTVEGAPVLYNLPSGPTQPRQLLQQQTVPPTFPSGDFRAYMPGRYAPDSPPGWGPPGGGAGGGGLDCESIASCGAMALKKILPELATAIAVQTARAGAQLAHPRPANVDPPVRGWDFNEAVINTVSVTDAAFVDVVEHLVPAGSVAVVKKLLVTAETPAALSDVEVRVLLDRVPVARYDSLNDPTLGVPGVGADVNIKASEGQRVTVQGRSRTAMVTHNIRALLRGWDYAPSRITNLESVDGWSGR